ncbi:hypothetical protein MauCBS54593_007159 [Microsporum audouinii]
MMFGSLPLIEPRDSHTLWYSSSYTGRSVANSSQNGTTNGQHPQSGRRNARSTTTATPLFSASFDPLSALLLEERALKLRKQNIASFGYSWIRPAGFPKTMMGIREEEMECEEGVGAGVGEGDVEEEEFMEGIEGGEGVGMGLDGQGGAGEGEEGDAGMERDLDGDIPDGDVEGFGLVEEGEEGYEDEEGEFPDDEEEGMMERDLDDDVPEALNGGSDDDDDDDDDEEEGSEEEEEEDGDRDGYDDTSEVRTPARITPGDSHMMMERDLDGSVPDAPQETPSRQQEWEHTDSDEDVYDDDDDDEEEEDDTDVENSRLSLASLPRGAIPRLTPSAPRRETEAERLFLERWGGNDDSIDFDSSGMLPENPLSISRRRSRRQADEESDLDDL